VITAFERCQRVREMKHRAAKDRAVFRVGTRVNTGDLHECEVKDA
jgi:hypothetical protein